MFLFASPMRDGFTLSKTMMISPVTIMKFYRALRIQTLFCEVMAALIAVRALGRRKYLAVVYKELSRKDGFVITAYSTSQISRRLIKDWQKGRP